MIPSRSKLVLFPAGPPGNARIDTDAPPCGADTIERFGWTAKTLELTEAPQQP
jgi:hypothetical protein